MKLKGDSFFMCIKNSRLVCILIIFLLCTGLFSTQIEMAYADSVEQKPLAEESITYLSEEPSEEPKEEEDPKTFEVKLNGMGVYVPISYINVTVGGIYSDLPELTRDNYSFLGWFTDPYGGEKIENGDAVEELVPYTLYAHWIGNEYTVYLDPSKGTISQNQIKVNYGNDYSMLPKPSRKGLEFMGWYTAKSGGKLVNLYDTVKLTNDTTLYAKWAPKWYLQTDKKWKNKWYRVRRESSTIGNAGCGPTTMAMVVASLKNEKVTPVTACKWSRSKGYKAYLSGTKDGFFKKYGKKYGITVKQTYYGDLRYTKKSRAKKYHNAAKNAVKKGNWVIVLAGKGNWTRGSGHFILWYKTEGDYAYIRDSNSTSSKRAKAKVSTLQKQAKRYWIISVPSSKKVN